MTGSVNEQIASVIGQKGALIDQVYTLGTPNGVYAADMRMIRTLYNLYSDDDLVQDFLGNKTIDAKENQYNIRVEYKKSDGSTYSPNHFELHNRLMGHWILHVSCDAAQDYQKNWLLGF